MTAIISAPELMDELAGTHAPVLLDVRWQLGGPDQRPAYEAGHLRGAVYVDLDRELAGPVSATGLGGRHPLPDPEDFGAAMRRAGVSAGAPVVVYDGGLGWAAARAWWLLRWTGHERVRVLDGGLPAWTAAGGELTTEEPSPREGDFKPNPGAMEVLDADGAAALARAGILLDARAGERYRGEVEPIDRVGGHVPGALSAPTTQNVGPDGRFLAAQALRARFEALGAAEGAPVGVYCGSGVSGAHEVLALEVAGIPAALYAGSWSDWSSDPDRPVATGGSAG
ncbi:MULTISPECIES: sulfurtransferase [unclassified Streptomyces]|uniref:sulfurtransferase n=1 Tax=unclassified Streptomyces TaxID=2593676 RepID=UPI002E2FA410|nr:MULTISPECIES: sulfurtransferase [unclassified Streptomyces]WUC64245.1 sulfurtransferase [Streptomyces sp. NBC_00539]